VDLERALEQFDAVEANLIRLELVWDELSGLIPSGPFPTDGSGPEDRRYRELQTAYERIMTGLPPIGSCRLEALPMGLTEIGACRVDALGIDDYSPSLDYSIAAPGREITEYRIQLSQARRELVSNSLTQLLSEIDDVLARASARIEPHRQDIGDDKEWQRFWHCLAKLSALPGAKYPELGGGESSAVIFHERRAATCMTSAPWTGQASGATSSRTCTQTLNQSPLR
jgi:hypothetical protein